MLLEKSHSVRDYQQAGWLSLYKLKLICRSSLQVVKLFLCGGESLGVLADVVRSHVHNAGMSDMTDRVYWISSAEIHKCGIVDNIKNLHSLVVVGIAMAYMGNSRPASGSEHHLSHYFEVTGLLRDEPYFAHGIDVAYSTYVTAGLREELLSFHSTRQRGSARYVEYMRRGEARTPQMR